MKIVSSYKDDESNTSSQTVLMMLVGGKTSGIHGAHLGPGVQIRYAAADAKRQTIPWVEYKGADGKTQTFVTAGAKGTDAMPKFEMQCVDCHNRPAHSFQLASRAVDEALASGKLPTRLPFLKKNAVEILSAAYATDEAAARAIPAKLEAFYKAKYPEICVRNTAGIASAGDTLAALYTQNVFPDLKVTWGTYVNNLGHTDSQGCFRCHDESHAAKGGKTITQDCSACHQMVAVDEASPEILKTLGIADRMSGLQNHR
jgi:formate-dependent nitrite reductase cytochrome c552 subunit